MSYINTDEEAIKKLASTFKDAPEDQELKELVTVSKNTSAEKIVEILDENGCIVIDRLAEPSLMDTVYQELQPHLEANVFLEDKFLGQKTNRVGGLIAKSKSARLLAVNKKILSVMDIALLRNATDYHISVTHLMDLAPGEVPQKIHRDQWAHNFYSWPKGYQVGLVTIWAVTDFTDSNGATRVAPGSHLWDDRLKGDSIKTIPAVMSKGSVFMYYASMYHGGGANVSSEHRIGLSLDYYLAWLRQEENQFLSCPPSVARELSPELAKLLGYKRACFETLGYYDDHKDPYELLMSDK